MHAALLPGNKRNKLKLTAHAGSHAAGSGGLLHQLGLLSAQHLAGFAYRMLRKQTSELMSECGLGS